MCACILLIYECVNVKWWKSMGIEEVVGGGVGGVEEVSECVCVCVVWRHHKYKYMHMKRFQRLIKICLCINPLITPI